MKFESSFVSAIVEISMLSEMIHFKSSNLFRIELIFRYAMIIPLWFLTRGRGLHDLRMDGGLPPGFQKGTLFQSPKVVVIPTYMMNFGGKRPIFLLFFANFWITHPCLWKICRKRDPCLENLGPKNPPIWAAHTRTLNMLCTPPPGVFNFQIFLA